MGHNKLVIKLQACGIIEALYWIKYFLCAHESDNIVQYSLRSLMASYKAVLWPLHPVFKIRGLRLFQLINQSEIVIVA